MGLKLILGRGGAEIEFRKGWGCDAPLHAHYGSGELIFSTTFIVFHTLVHCTLFTVHT